MDLLYRKISKDSFWMVLIKAVSLFSAFILHIYLGRNLGPEGYGTVIFFLAIIGFISWFALFGMPSMLTRFTVIYSERKEWGHLRGLLSFCFFITIVASLSFVVIIWFSIHFIKIDIPQIESNAPVFFLLPIYCLILIIKSALQGFHHIKVAVVLDELILPLLFLIGVFLFSINDVYSTFVIYGIALFLVLFIAMKRVASCLPAIVHRVGAVYETRKWIAVALPLLMASSGQLILARIDIFVLGTMTKMTSVGLYGGASRLALIIVIVGNVISVVLAPVIVSLYNKGEMNKLFNSVALGILISICFSIPIYVGVLMAPEFFLSFYGVEYQKAGDLLKILATGQFFLAMLGPLQVLLIMTSGEKTFFKIISVIVAINVVGDFLVVQYWGATGVAFITTICAMIQCVAVFIAAKKILSNQYGIDKINEIAS